MKSSRNDTRFYRFVRLTAIACLALPLLSACGGSSGSSGSSGSASSSTLNLGITDGPTVLSATAVDIYVSGVEIQPSGGGTLISFPIQPAQKINLLQEQGGNVASLLSGQSVPAGNYAWMRLMLSTQPGQSPTITIGGSTYPFTLIIPSGAHTGLKLVQGFTMTANQVANFTIDFMLQQSITAPPGQTTAGVQDYILRPALRLVNDAQAGTISGTVTFTSLISTNQTTCLADYNGSGPLPNAQIDIFSGSNVAPATSLTPVVEPEITYSSAKNAYTYDQPFLLAGTYTVALACTSTGATPTTTFPAYSQNVTVTANQTTTVNLPPP